MYFKVGKENSQIKINCFLRNFQPGCEWKIYDKNPHFYGESYFDDVHSKDQEMIYQRKYSHLSSSHYI